MPGSELEALIEELEDLINDAKSPISGGGAKKIIDANTAYQILDDMKGALPEEFQKARRILRERDEMLTSAEEEAAHIVQDARDHANMLASEQEVVRLAHNQAEEIRRDAEKDAREIRYWAENSAEETFGKLAGEMQQVIDKTQGLLEQVSYCRNLLAGQAGELEAAEEDGDDRAYDR